jgi:putative serine protease PepD
VTSTRTRIATAVSAAAVAGAGAGAVALSDGATTAPPATVAANANVANVAQATLSVADIAKRTTPGVVEVDASSAQASAGPFGNGGSSSAEGTGFVYDSKGDIVTNEHVVDGASSVKVKLSDGSTYTATVVGTDISSDLAVLHVDAPSSKLQPLTLGDSSKAAVGEGVVAVGNPFGLDGSVTTGIVSAVDREIQAPDDTPIEGAIQTDAAINHGNSGGPLLDMSGDVIGVTSQIQSDSGGNDGVGFAIPSNTVKAVAAQLIAGGKVQHALLGVDVTTGANGVGVAQVESGSAGSDAGVRAGDVITAVNGGAVTTPQQLRAIVAAHKPGDTLSLTLRRNGSTKTVKATLGSRT